MTRLEITTLGLHDFFQLHTFYSLYLSSLVPDDNLFLCVSQSKFLKENNKQTNKQRTLTSGRVPFIMTFEELLGSHPKVKHIMLQCKHTLTTWGFHSRIRMLYVLVLSEHKLETYRTYEVISVVVTSLSHQSLPEQNCSEKCSVVLHSSQRKHL